MSVRYMLIAALVLAACDTPAGLPDLSVATVEVGPADRTLTVGDTMLVTAFPRTADGTLLGGRLVEWVTEDSSVASLVPKGAVSVVTARQPGTVEIIAEVEGRTGSIGVTVVAAPLVVAAVELTPEFGGLEVGTQANLVATARTADGVVIGGRSVTWQSSDPTIATIFGAADGAYVTVTAHRAGTVVITATIDGRQAQRTIVVTAVSPVAFMSIVPDSLAVEAGAEFGMEAWTYRSNGAWLDSATVTWTTTDNTVATVVSSSGRKVVLRALRAGTIEVVGTAGGATDRATLRVLAPVVVSRIDIPVSLTGLSVWSSSLHRFNAQVYDANGQLLTNAPVQWRLENPALGDMRADGLLHALQPGTTRVLATSGGRTASASLTIYPVPTTAIEVELHPGVDPFGLPRVLVPVATSTWTDSAGAEHVAHKYLTSGKLVIGGATPGFTQRLDFETVVALPNQPWHVVARDTTTLSGTALYGVIEPLSTYTLQPTGGAEFHAHFSQPGRLVVSQTVGGAPLLDYVWLVRLP